MKHLTGILFTALLAHTQLAHSQDVYVLRSEESGQYVSRVNQGAISEVLKVNQVAVYGATERALAVLSYKAGTGGFILDIIDLRAGTVAASWPVDEEPVMQLSGTSRGIVLSDAYAYFLTMTFGTSGASFRLSQLALADGSIRTLTIPQGFANPRLTDFEGTPLLTSWNGFGVVKFDPSTQEFEQLVSRVDVGEVLSKEEVGKRTGQINASASADHVAVSGAGVFRLSKLGDLHQVLNPDLSPVDADRSIPLGPTENILRLFPTTSEDRPAIGLVRKVGDRLQLECIDAESLSVVWKKTLPGDVVPQTVVGSMNNEVFYFDRSEGSIKRISKRSDRELYRLPKARLIGATILAVSDSD
jgi:hypothetical protein